MPDPATDLVAGAICSAQQVVVIVGAGASVDAGIPTGCQVGERLDRSDQLILRNELRGEPKSWAFFDVIDVLARFRGEEGARRRLQKILEPQFVSLSYEILAHYLHHGGIKAVISLNHDEALDHALALESPQFQYVARSRSDFDALQERLQASDALPTAYLKVHGCVSRKLTFRINRSSVAQLEPEKLGVLEKYFAMADMVVCIGWSMHDPDVFRPLTETRTRSGRRQLVVVNPSPTEELQALVDGFRGTLCRLDAAAFLSEVGDWVDCDRQQRSRSVGLHRHHIRAKCFGGAGPLKRDARAQATIEVIMLALKARAQIEPRIVFECGRISRLLATLESQGSQRCEEAQVIALAEILEHLCAAQILSRGKASITNTYWLNAAGPHDRADDVLRSIAANVVAQLMTRHYLNPEATPPGSGWRQDLEDHLVALTTAFDVDLIPRASDFAMFSLPKLIVSQDSFEKCTQELFAQLSTERSLHISANTGEWILKHLDVLTKPGIRRCNLVTEDYESASDGNAFKRIATGRIKEVKRTLEAANIATTVKVLRGKVHQLTAVFADDETCLQAIYFRREGKSTRISPVKLTDSRDLGLVADIWRNLWHDSRDLMI